MSKNAPLQIAPEPLANRPSKARVQAVAARVRPLVEDDLEGVAELFLQRFRPSRRSARAKAEVAAYMKALYLDCPHAGGDVGSLVSFDDAGVIAAFVGCNGANFRFDGAKANVGVSGTLMASSAPGHALAAVQLLRASRKLDYDLIVTDSANRASLAMCQAMNYHVASPESLEWAYVFAPTSLALHKSCGRLGPPG